MLITCAIGKGNETLYDIWMSINDKNELQIYCQRNNLELPIYSQSRDENSGKWISTVTFLYKGAKVSEKGEGCNKKTNADISAARSVIDKYRLPVQSRAKVNSAGVENCDISLVKRAHTTLDFCNTAAEIGMYVLVDYENVNTLQHLHNTFRNESGREAKIYKFLSYSHHKAETKDASHIIHSAGSDAVDHAISIFIGILLSNWSKAHNQDLVVLILTRDRFAERVHNMLRFDTEGTRGPIVVHIPSEEQCVKYLKVHGYERTLHRYVYDD